jgi:hypothetical protein
MPTSRAGSTGATAITRAASTGTRGAKTFDAPIVAQLSQLRVDDATVARLRERAGEPIPVDTTLQRRAIEAYLAENRRLNAELDASPSHQRPRRRSPTVPPSSASCAT